MMMLTNKLNAAIKIIHLTNEIEVEKINKSNSCEKNTGKYDVTNSPVLYEENPDLNNKVILTGT